MFPYHRPDRLPLLLGITAAISILGSCGSDELIAPTEGTVQVTTSTSGADLDADGYTVSLDGGAPQAMEIVDTVIIPEVEPGDHTLVLGGVAPNCIVGLGLNQRVTTVPVGDTVKVAFAVTCEAIQPPPGDGDPPPQSSLPDAPA